MTSSHHHHSIESHHHNTKTTRTRPPPRPPVQNHPLHLSTKPKQAKHCSDEEHGPELAGTGEKVAGADLSLVVRRLIATSSHRRRRLVYIVKERFGFEREE
ncbi:hypothetical protein QL285_019872 [Trifolium repens]|nr:hypothetical protein QL285_019872 [Trifolium repens]